MFVSAGFYFLQPNQAAAILLFGSYKGTDRTTGLRWRWPWLTRTKISTRVHNVTSERLKVNDLRGNPIEIASNVVWRVSDTAQALYDVDDYNKFLFVQIESAVRAIGARYPYDDIEHQETTLRGHADIVNEELKDELQDRVAVAGITVDECRLTHLAYAQEIAQAMLRRQQAEAVISDGSAVLRAGHAAGGERGLALPVGYGAAARPEAKEGFPATLGPSPLGGAGACGGYGPEKR
jgi:regulator of protease activity HflC (stomatin/prohibitin superfamily)